MMSWLYIRYIEKTSDVMRQEGKKLLSKFRSIRGINTAIDPYFLLLVRRDLACAEVISIRYPSPTVFGN